MEHIQEQFTTSFWTDSRKLPAFFSVFACTEISASKTCHGWKQAYCSIQRVIKSYSTRTAKASTSYSICTCTCTRASSFRTSVKWSNTKTWIEKLLRDLRRHSEGRAKRETNQTHHRPGTNFSQASALDCIQVTLLQKCILFVRMIDIT